MLPATSSQPVKNVEIYTIVKSVKSMQLWKSVKIHTIVDLSVLERHFRSKVADEYVTKEEKHIVVHLTMHLHKFYKEYSMTILLIYGV